MRDGDAGELRDGLHGVGRTARVLALVLLGGADGVGGVDLLLAAVGPKVDERVSVDGDERDLLVGGVDARKQDGVGAVGGVIGAILRALGAVPRLVDADEQHVERVAARRLGELAAQGRVDSLVELAGDVGEVREGHGAAQRQHGDDGDDHGTDGTLGLALGAGAGIAVERGA